MRNHTLFCGGIANQIKSYNEIIVRVIVKIRPLSQVWTTCPPESFWNPERFASLSRTESRAFTRHSQRCEVCEARQQLFQPSERALETASARVAAALVASVLLTAALRFHPTRVVVFEDVYAFLPAPDAVQRSVAAHLNAAEEPAVEVEEASVTQEAKAPVHRKSTVLELVGPKRFFVEPARALRRADRTEPPPRVLEAPPVIANVRLDVPSVLQTSPALPPPRKNPLRRFAAVIAQPFRHI